MGRQSNENIACALVMIVEDEVVVQNGKINFPVDDGLICAVVAVISNGFAETCAQAVKNGKAAHMTEAAAVGNGKGEFIVGGDKLDPVVHGFDGGVVIDGNGCQSVRGHECQGDHIIHGVAHVGIDDGLGQKAGICNGEESKL